jgi:hypothetical protein
MILLLNLLYHFLLALQGHFHNVLNKRHYLQLQMLRRLRQKASSLLN